MQAVRPATAGSLASAGQSWWQVLPLGPPEGLTGSPYMSPSAFAGSPGILADPEAPVADDEADAFRTFWPVLQANLPAASPDATLDASLRGQGFLVPLAWVPRHLLVRNGICGLHPDPVGMLDWTRLWRSRRSGGQCD